MCLLRRFRIALPMVVIACAAPLTPLVTAQHASASVASASSASTSSSGGPDSLEQAAKRAGDTGRKVAMYLIGLAFAFAAVLLVFKRDFREAAAIFGVGILAVLLATPSGLETLRSTVDTLFR